MIKVIDNSKSKFVFSPYNGKIFNVDEQMLSAILSVDKVGVFDPTKLPQKDEYVNQITLLIAQCCNLCCDYCFASDGTYSNSGLMAIDTAKATIDFFVAQSQSKKLRVSFFGGEPLMNFDLISETVSYCKKIEEKCDFNFTYATTTNGTLLNKDIQSFLVENRFFMYLSIDGRKEIHDTSRKYKDGKGSYENIINITEGFRGNKNVIGRATVIPTESMVDSYKHLCELGFNQIVVSPVHMEMTSEERKQTSLHQVELINHFYGLIDNGEFDKAKKLRNILIPLYKIHTGAIRDIFCNAGTGKVIVDFKGDVFYCAEVVSKQNFRLGNVFSEVDFSKLYSFADMPSYCKDCWCWCLCSGGCPMLREYNSKEEQLMQFCESQRNYYSALLSVYVQLTQQNKDFLFESFVN